MAKKEEKTKTKAASKKEEAAPKKKAEAAVEVVEEQTLGETASHIVANIFDKVSIRIASPETIRSWSKGEVKNPETINYRTFKPEKGGLFCEKIFGPTKDWECNCGKYKRIKHKGVVCDRCGVEVTQSKVRRERMGHIDLAAPAAHIWFLKTMPSRIGNILGLSSRTLERVIYYEDYIVIDAGETPLEAKQLLSELEYREAQEKYGRKFTAKMGAEAIKELLKREPLDDLAKDIREKLDKTKSKQTGKKIAKRLKIVEGFRKSGNCPDWMVLDVVPVIPPDLRPLVPLEGGRFATSDLNDLYRRVINRNNRLRSILELKTPDVIVRNEKRMLQEAVDALFDNGRHGRPVVGTGNRPLKSLADMLKGKQGRFRQNLLGKRVDYSGRSVIVIGPELKLHQCGLPKAMALELFEPFIIRKLKERGLVHTIRSAKKLIEKQSNEVWDVLEEIIKGHTVLLNRAPTLHRLGIQAFEPLLIEGKAIRIHPLVCTAFNADFDGDQMAVHVPLSFEAQAEARLLMLATNNIFSPSSGKPITIPTQDITLGCYYITLWRPPNLEGRIMVFNDPQEAILAYDEKVVGLHNRIKMRIKGRIVETTVGRVLFNEVLPKEMEYVNETVGKKRIGEIIIEVYQKLGHQRTVELLDKLKELGFREATRAGISIGVDDMIIPKEKIDLLDLAQNEINEVDKQYRSGSITDGERYNKIIDIWTHTTDKVAEALFRGLEYNRGNVKANPIFIMVDSGSRGSRQQIRQLAGMRGLMAKPSGEIIESPIIANFREGLSVLEYFISTHGARKGLADTALKTADSGYLTRKLVDVAQDVIVTVDDCKTLNGITARAITEGDDEMVSLFDRILGRVALEDVKDPVTGDVIVKRNEEIVEAKAKLIQKIGLHHVRIRSVLTCEAQSGCCAKCYGRNLATGRMVDLGEAVGIIAAQSIGEPGTQLTMRTFHIGGTASQTFKQPQIISKNDGVVKFHDLKVVEAKDKTFIVLNKNGFISVHNDEGRELEKYNVVIGSVISVPENGRVKKGQAFVKWDPYNIPILTEKPGTVEFHDFIEDVTMKKEIDESTGLIGRVIMEHKEELHPQIILYDDNKEPVAYYSIPAGAHIVVEESEKVSAGSLLAKTPRKVSKTKDITGGLPRVAELFEARRPKDAAEIARIDGLVEFGGTLKGRRRLIVKDVQTGSEEEHLIPHGKHLIVFKGDHVKKGQQLTEGPIVPQEILQVCGPRDLQEYLVNQIQEVYRLQGVEINDKHIEVIIRQMLRKVKIIEPGDTNFIYDEQIDKMRFDEENKRVRGKKGKPAEAAPLLLGITKASLSTDSFISAASFQETTRILTDAAANGRTDVLRGFKENVIMGHVIPAGTGFSTHRSIEMEKAEEEETPEDAAQEA